MKVLSIYEIIIKENVIPPNTIVTLCSSMCLAFNFDKDATEKALEVMHNLLISSPMKYKAFQALVDIMNYSQMIELYRGAIFYVTTVSWGEYHSEKFRDSFVTVLQAMLKVMTQKNEEVAYEIALSIWNLVKRFGEQLIIEWDIVIQILMELNKYLNGEKKEFFEGILAKILDQIYKLYKSNDYFGSYKDYCKLVRMYKYLCATSVSIELLSDMQKQLHPAYMNWLSDLKQILDDFFAKDSRVKVNEKVLDIVRSILWMYSNIAENAILDVLLPFFNQITNFNNADISLRYESNI
jgi:hypothetical protein